jgi:hypothetical protein
MFYDLHKKILFYFFVMAKSDQKRIQIRIGLAPWSRIRIEVKSWIWIRIGTKNADPQHWKPVETVAKKSDTAAIMALRNA